jgi:hypothetical protein
VVVTNGNPDLIFKAHYSSWSLITLNVNLPNNSKIQPTPLDSLQNVTFPLDLPPQYPPIESNPPPSLNDVLGELDSKKPAATASEEDILRKRETARSWLAKALIYSLWGTITVTFSLVLIDRFMLYSGKTVNQDQGEDLITLIWTAQTTLVGTALGFYFGERDS